jgi:hypothetical protein
LPEELFIFWLICYLKRMRCQICSRALPEDEPVYRAASVGHGMNLYMQFLRTSGGAAGSVGSVCGHCIDHISVNFNDWRPAVPCHNCGRPVFTSRWRKDPTKYIVCSVECRRTVYLQRARDRRRGQRLAPT